MPIPIPRLHWQTTDRETVRLYQGDVRAVLARLPERSVHMAVTSPPYWGLRDYGATEFFPSEGDARAWAKGEAARRNASAGPTVRYLDRGARWSEHRGQWAGSVGSEVLWEDGWCAFGSEERPEAFVRHCVEMFWAVRRVLRDDGTLWLNLGDTYSGGGRGDAGGQGTTSEKQLSNGGTEERTRRSTILSSGNLLGMPWRVALALQEDGWILRSDIPWVKRAPMPESVKNRPAKALEYVFLFAKRMGYYYDHEAVKKRSGGPAERITGGKDGTYTKTGSLGQMIASGKEPSGGNSVPGSVMRTGEQRNFWQADLWFESVDKPHGLTRVGDEVVGIDATSRGYPGAHYATYPPNLIEPFVKAGTSERGCCADCGAPWRRLVEERAVKRERPNDYVKRAGEEGTGSSCGNTVAGVDCRTVGWRPTCECHGRLVKKEMTVTGQAICDGDGNIPNGWAIGGRSHSPAEYQVEGEAEDKERQRRRAAEVVGKRRTVTVTVTEYVSDLPLDEHPVVPCVVLDPFVGSGTTCQVSLELGRRSVGVDLSEDYLRRNAVPRIEGILLGRPGWRELVPSGGGGVRKLKPSFSAGRKTP